MLNPTKGTPSDPLLFLYQVLTTTPGRWSTLFQPHTQVYTEISDFEDTRGLYKYFRLLMKVMMMMKMVGGCGWFGWRP